MWIDMRHAANETTKGRRARQHAPATWGAKPLKFHEPSNWAQTGNPCEGRRSTPTETPIKFCEPGGIAREGWLGEGVTKPGRISFTRKKRWGVSCPPHTRRRKEGRPTHPTTTCGLQDSLHPGHGSNSLVRNPEKQKQKKWGGKTSLKTMADQEHFVVEIILQDMARAVINKTEKKYNSAHSAVYGRNKRKNHSFWQRQVDLGKIDFLHPWAIDKQSESSKKMALE